MSCVGAWVGVCECACPTCPTHEQAPVVAAPVAAPMAIYPSVPQQVGSGEREWDVRDRLPWPDDAAIPTGHIASRVSGRAFRAPAEAGGHNNGEADWAHRSGAPVSIPNLQVSRTSPRRGRGQRLPRASPTSMSTPWTRAGPPASPSFTLRASAPPLGAAPTTTRTTPFRHRT